MSDQRHAEFPKHRHRAGLSIAEAAALLGVSSREIRRYETGDVAVPPISMMFLKAHADERAAAHRKPGTWFSFIDLFAGIGGMRLGFEAIGGKCVFTCEWDKYSQQTYRKNFPDDDDHQFASDIRRIDIPSIPAHDVLLAGFPCQPFSIAGVSKKNALGRPHGFDCDKQGTLFFEIEKIVRHHQPKAFLLENVKNLERHDRGQTFQVIMKTLTEELGYETVEHKVISSHPWVPQKRERIFIVGFRKKCGFSFRDFEKWVPPESGHPRLGTILQPHNEVDSKYTLSQHLWNYLQEYKKKHAGKGNGFGYSTFGPGDVTRTLSARYFKDGSEILVAQGNGRPRRLTPTECARLMGFERDDREWHIPVSDTQAYKQFGNAVVVPVVEAVARHMEPHVREAMMRNKPLADALKPAQKDLELAHA